MKNMQKKIYEEPTAELIVFSEKDIIMNSQDEGWSPWV